MTDHEFHRYHRVLSVLAECEVGLRAAMKTFSFPGAEMVPQPDRFGGDLLNLLKQVYGMRVRVEAALGASLPSTGRRRAP